METRHVDVRGPCLVLLLVSSRSASIMVTSTERPQTTEAQSCSHQNLQLSLRECHISRTSWISHATRRCVGLGHWRTPRYCCFLFASATTSLVQRQSSQAGRERLWVFFIRHAHMRSWPSLGDHSVTVTAFGTLMLSTMCL